MDLALLKQYAISMIGKPYFWSGDDPISGFDCSGFASELLRAAGLVPYTYRSNAQGIYNDLRKAGALEAAGTGSFAFYGKSLNEISHVTFCVDSVTMIEAGGGGSDTISDALASAKNAFVRMRPILYRKDFLVSLRPNY